MQTQMETQSIPAPTPSSALVLDDSGAADAPDDESAAPVHGYDNDGADDDELFGSDSESDHEGGSTSMATITMTTRTMKSLPESGSSFSSNRLHKNTQ
jgi:hypothetical protein